MAKPAPKKTKETPYSKAEELVGYQGLTKEQVQEIDKMLLLGDTVNRVCTHMIEQWSITAVSRQALQQRIKRHKEQVIGKGLVLAYDLLNPETKDELQEALRTDIDALHELEQLAAIQARRLERAMKFEHINQQNPYLRKDVTSNIRNLREILDSLAKLQMDLGILKRAPIELKGNLNISQSQRDTVFKGLDTSKTLAEITMGTLGKIMHIPQTIENEVNE